MQTERPYVLTFENQYVDVTGRFLPSASFVECVVERRLVGDESTYLGDTIFEWCTFTGDGWPDGFYEASTEGR